MDRQSSELFRNEPYRILVLNAQREIRFWFVHCSYGTSIWVYSALLFRFPKMKISFLEKFWTAKFFEKIATHFDRNLR